MDQVYVWYRRSLNLLLPRARCAAVQAMMRTLHHRGPDDHGYFEDADCRLGLGHLRLSIIDLSAAGHQPMFNEDGTVVLVFNGEIYNFLELREKLSQRGHRFLRAPIRK